MNEDEATYDTSVIIKSYELGKATIHDTSADMDVIYSDLETLGGELHTTERKAEDVRLIGELPAIERSKNAMRLDGCELKFQHWTVRMIAKIDTIELHNQHHPRKLLSMAPVSIAAAFLFALGFTIPAGAQTATLQSPSTKSQGVPDWQKAAAGKMSFEVASIKQSKSATVTGPNFLLNTSDSYETADPGGRLSADFPLAVYIEFAYKIKLTDEQGHSMLARLPKWASTDNFEINAKAKGNPTKDQMRLMMQSLLADRFKLAIHFKTQHIPALALILDKPGKTGPKLRPHSEGPPCEVPAVLKEVDLSSKNFVYPPICNLVAMRPKENHGMVMGTRNATMKRIAGEIASVGDQGRPVLDRTGLRGRFDFTLEWTPDANSPVSSDWGALPVSKTLDLLEALKEQLGLKLKTTKATIRVPVIDHVERPSEN